MDKSKVKFGVLASVAVVLAACSSEQQMSLAVRERIMKVN